MRIPLLLSLALLLSCQAWAQATATPEFGHFDGWPSSGQWGGERLSFSATTGRVRQAPGLFTVARNGFGWRRAFSNSEGSFFRWSEVSAWCSTPGALQIRIGDDQYPAAYGNISAEDMLTIVDTYFRKYVENSEVSDPGQACTRAALRIPDGHDRIVELLEAATGTP